MKRVPVAALLVVVAISAAGCGGAGQKPRSGAAVELRAILGAKPIWIRLVRVEGGKLAWLGFSPEGNPPDRECLRPPCPQRIGPVAGFVDANGNRFDGWADVHPGAEPASPAAVVRSMNEHESVRLVKSGGVGSRGTSSTRPSGSSRGALVVPLSRKALAKFRLRSLPRFLSPTRLVIYTWGSGSCPAVPDRLVVLSSHSIRIHLTIGSWRGRLPVPKKPGSHYGCTTDLRTATMAVGVDPRQIDVHRRVTIRFYYYGSRKPITRTAPPL